MVGTPRYAAEGVPAVGVTRKLLSTCSAGLVDFRSDRERVARSARKTLHATRAGNRLLRQVSAPAAPFFGGPVLPPAGWYPDQGRPDRLRWWDGQQWTPRTATVDQG